MKVRKKSGQPFKSGLKVNTVKATIEHPILKQKYGQLEPAYTFYEDESYVAICQCEAVNDN